MASPDTYTIFSNYHPNGNHINPSLLWEYDTSTFDWQRSKTIVVQRVVELLCYTRKLSRQARLNC